MITALIKLPSLRLVLLSNHREIAPCKSFATRWKHVVGSCCKTILQCAEQPTKERITMRSWYPEANDLHPLIARTPHIQPQSRRQLERARPSNQWHAQSLHQIYLHWFDANRGMLKPARTIAELAWCEEFQSVHLAALRVCSPVRRRKCREGATISPQVNMGSNSD